MVSAYLFCVVVGLAWTVANFALGKVLGGGDASADTGDAAVSHDFVAGGHGAGGHGDAFTDAVDASGAVALPLFSPTALAGYLTGFGATGLLLTQGIGIESAIFHVPLSLAGALVMGVSIAYATVMLMRAGETSSETRVSTLVGKTGELSVGIPGGGVGEVMYLAGGGRSSAPARSSDGTALVQGTRVRIVRIDAGNFLVAPADALPPVDGEPVAAPQRGKERA